MSDATLLAALYLEAVLPVLPQLAAHDAPLAATLAGPDFAVSLLAPGHLRCRLAVSAGVATHSASPRAADIRLWFPSARQIVRAFDGRRRPALALPLSGFHLLLRARRLVAAGARLETLLNTRAAAHLALHAWGNLYVGLRASAVWLRRHPDGPATHTRLGHRTAVFTCPAFPAPLWIDLATLTTGTGEPPTLVHVRIEFTDLSTLIAELDQRLDAPAALGLGTLRITGHLLLAEHLSLVLLKVGKLLKKQY